jgi:alginate O-acetyltransferase complex protein AlgI
VSVGTKAFVLFLLVVLVGYHLLRQRTAKYAYLLAASWVFYAVCSPRYLWVLLLLTLLDFIVAKRIEGSEGARRTRWLIVSILANLGLLFAFKYTPFMWDTGSSLLALMGYEIPSRTWELLLPLGISFHTFQGISYTVDVYRRQIRAVTSFLDYALFVAFFPQMAAGPIVRAVEFLPQMATPPTPSAEQLSDGVYLFVRGLFKKLIIADHLDTFVRMVFDEPTAFCANACRLALLAWTVQIYCDFSGYSDIAIGVAKLFGFEFPANFYLPYLATSPTDFWRRWHLSLSTWLRDYLYFPLGGSRGNEFATWRNLVIVFVLCGLWHGPTWAWVAYGFYYGALMCGHRVWDRLFRGAAWRTTYTWMVIAWMCTIVQLMLSLILVRMTDWTSGSQMVQGIIGVSEGARALPPLVLGLCAMGLVGHFVGWRSWSPRWTLLRPLLVAFMIEAILVFAPGVQKTFIYIQF